MAKSTKIVIVFVLGIFIVAAFAVRSMRQSPSSTAASVPDEELNPLPRLLDLGAGKCIPCKMMAPILEELAKEYEGRMEVEFIDVWKDPDAGQPYDIRLIPTQIFFDAAGRELFRHEGFYSKEDILMKWKELGTDLEKPET